MPQKFLLTTPLLALVCGAGGAAAAHTPRHTYMWLAFDFLATGCSLALYSESNADR